MSMKHIECGNKKFMSILLFITSQVASMGPHEMQKFVRYVRSAFTRIELTESTLVINLRQMFSYFLKELKHLTDKAHRPIFDELTKVFVG